MMPTQWSGEPFRMVASIRIFAEGVCGGWDKALEQNVH